MTYIIAFEVSFNLWFRVLGLQFRVQGLEFWVWGSGFGFRVQALVFSIIPLIFLLFPGLCYNGNGEQLLRSLQDRLTSKRSVMVPP